MNSLREYIRFYNQRVFPSQIILFLIGIIVAFAFFLNIGASFNILIRFIILYSFLHISVSYPFNFTEMLKKFPIMIIIIIVCSGLSLLFLFHFLEGTPSPGIINKKMNIYISSAIITWSLLLYPVL